MMNEKEQRAWNDECEMMNKKQRREGGRLVGRGFLFILHPSAFILFLTMVCAGHLKASAAQDRPSSDTIVITQEDLEEFERGDLTSPTTETEIPATSSARSDSALIGLETCYGFPFRECLYWHWLETGALSVIAETEAQIDELMDDFRQLGSSRAWSEQQQRELERIEDEIERLERDREQSLAERIVSLEVVGDLSPAQRAEAAVLYMARALNDLDAGKAKEAVESLDLAEKHLRGEPLVGVLRAIAQREAGQGDAAAAPLRAALAKQPRLLLGLIAMAELHEDDLDYGQAARFWDEARGAQIDFPHGIEQWANRARERFPQGEESLRQAWSAYLLLRLRLARLREFAHKYYLSYEKSGYRVVYDPSIGAPWSEKYVGALREVVRRYLEEGAEAVEPAQVERLFEQMRRDRDDQGFSRLMVEISGMLAKAERDVRGAIEHPPSQRPVVVLYNPAVWEALVARRTTLGLFQPRGRSISIYLEPLTSPRALKDLESTVYHEYAHFLAFDITGPRGTPLWMAEGLAELLALESRYDRYAEDPVLSRWRPIWDGERISRPWFDKGAEAFGLADYYKARRAMGLLVDRFGPRGLRTFLEALGGGADLDEASREAFEMDYRELQRFLVKRLPSWAGE